jgi:predicted amidohydrolase YtcJ
MKTESPVNGSCHCSAAEAVKVLYARPTTNPGVVPEVAPPTRAQAGARADVVLTGRFITMNPDQPTAEAIAVQNGRIIAIGTASDVDGYLDANTRRLALADGYVTPGLVEPHMHYTMGAVTEGWVNCSPFDGKSYDDVLVLIHNAGPVLGDWTLGMNYDPSLLPGSPELTVQVLDAVVHDRPVFVLNASGHLAYVNSEALRRAGITKDTPNPTGASYGRDANGDLTGVLSESAAMTAVIKQIPVASQNVAKSLVNISKLAASRGVTRMHDAGTGGIAGQHDVGVLHQVASHLWCRSSYAVIDGAADEIIVKNGLKPFAGDDMMRATHWKYVSDGSNQGYTGYQVEPYLGRATRGSANYTPQALQERLALAASLNWPTMVHANGDAAIAMVIEAYRIAVGAEKNAVLRNRIEHCSFTTDQNLTDMRELSLSPSFLMNHVYFWGAAFRDTIMGEPKADHLDRVASALKAGLRASVHSDFTVTQIDPLLEAQTAATRIMRANGEVLNPAERVTVADALSLITTNAAWQLHSEKDVGSLRVGAFADLAVLDSNPLTTEAAALGAIKVYATYLGGEQKYSA